MHRQYRGYAKFKQHTGILPAREIQRLSEKQYYWSNHDIQWFALGKLNWQAKGINSSKVPTSMFICYVDRKRREHNEKNRFQWVDYMSR
jgi:hypothetical protein